ncbi:molybdopterin-binding protein [Oceanisphaera arctica]|uniref:Molybdopterin-binding protein n=1 Tax=Oceanisphaera arctica TaxID=641510 RepID=A0A2P5TI33_9GAMM|nr:molybdopterin-binding protein [Oceanisphaera arctica]PPL14245.1 molybdopterin-binding protein [Oceanisphaera arctica]GHA29519.1 molybdopterin-binding oxidoreductase [Oceanisphaera arctica]
MKLMGRILMLLLLSWQAQATEPVVLTLYGDIQLDDRQYDRLDFTLSELQALPQADITTAHPWVTQAHHYHGVDLNRLMARLFGHRRVVSLYLEALNGFSVAVDWPQISPFSPIIAWQEDERLMSRRNKGPLWLMLPYDRVPKVQQADFLHFMAWQLRVIRVLSEPE